MLASHSNDGLVPSISDNPVPILLSAKPRGQVRGLSHETLSAGIKENLVKFISVSNFAGDSCTGFKFKYCLKIQLHVFLVASHMNQ